MVWWLDAVDEVDALNGVCEAMEAAQFVRSGLVIIPKNHWVENWTSPAFDTLGERDEEIEIYGKPDPGDFEAMMRIRK